MKVLLILFPFLIFGQDSIKTHIQERAYIYSYPSIDSLTSNYLSIFTDVFIVNSFDQFYELADNGFVLKRSVFKNEDLELYEQGLNKIQREEFKKEKQIAIEKKEQERKQSLIKKYGRKNAQRILDGIVWIGMTKEMALESWGEPNDINRTITAYGTHEQWVYPYGYLYFENGKLTAIQD